MARTLKHAVYSDSWNAIHKRLRRARGRFGFAPGHKRNQGHLRSLSDEQVAVIRQRYASGESQSDIARSLGIRNVTTVHNIVRGKTYLFGKDGPYA